MLPTHVLGEVINQLTSTIHWSSTGDKQTDRVALGLDDLLDEPDEGVLSRPTVRGNKGE